MKKFWIAIGCWSILGGLVLAGAKQFEGKRFLFQLDGSVFFAADRRFNDVYSARGIHPGIKFSCAVTPSIVVSLGYDYLFHRGETVVTGADTESTQHTLRLAGGIGYSLTPIISCRLEGGIFHGWYREEVLEELLSGSGLGFLLEGSLVVRLPRGLRGLVILGYRYGKDHYQGQEIVLGGFRAGVGAGIVF